MGGMCHSRVRVRDRVKVKVRVRVRVRVREACVIVPSRIESTYKSCNTCIID